MVTRTSSPTGGPLNNDTDLPDFLSENFAAARGNLIQQGLAEDAVLEVLHQNWLLFHSLNVTASGNDSGHGHDDEHDPPPEEEDAPPRKTPSPHSTIRGTPQTAADASAHPHALGAADKPIVIDFSLAPPTHTQDRPARVAEELLRRRRYCQLDYFTDRGMKLAKKIDPNAPEAIQLTPVAGIRDDSQLTLDEIHNAVPRFLKYITEFQWGEHTVLAHADFFSRLDTFPGSRDRDVQPGLALVVERWRKEWHACLSRGVVWNIAAIPDVEVQRTIDEACRKCEAIEHRAAQDRRDAEHCVALVSHVVEPPALIYLY